MQQLWEKFWSTHNKGIVYASIGVFGLAILFLANAYSINLQAEALIQENNNLPNNQPTIDQTERIFAPVMGEEFFEMPSTLDNSSDWITKIVYKFQVSNGTLAQNSLIANFTFNIEFELPIPIFLHIESVEVKPVDLMHAYITYDPQLGYIYQGFYPVSLYLTKITDTDATSKQVWSGYSLQQSVFQKSGPVILELTIKASPQESYLNKTNLQNFQRDYEPYFTKTVFLNGADVRSTESIIQQFNAQQQIAILQALNNSQTLMEKQQTIYDLKNTSLTFFVLFFAAIDIAVVVFDHSKDDNKKAEYEKKKAEEENRNRFQQNFQVI